MKITKVQRAWLLKLIEKPEGIRIVSGHRQGQIPIVCARKLRDKGLVRWQWCGHYWRAVISYPGRLAVET